MSQAFSITADWLRLDEGDADERATFASLGIVHNDVWLTEGRDRAANAVRLQPFVSASLLAEWLTWNWWRIRWEARSTKRSDWSFAHTMTSIGNGYEWPNLTIFSDDVRTVLLNRQSSDKPTAAFRYLNDHIGILPASTFFGEVDRFVVSVLERLSAEGINDSNLSRLWRDLQTERSDPKLRWKRKIEALLGVEPDDGDPKLLERLKADATQLSESGVEEIAAASFDGSEIPSAEELTSLAVRSGTDQSPRDMPKVKPTGIGTREAWRVGKDLAEQVRQQINKPDEPLLNAQLAKIAGVSAELLTTQPSVSSPLAFAIERQNTNRVFLSHKWEESRRFNLARIVGDELAFSTSSKLHPVTRSHTYRQQLQRSFAAELLCPFDALEEHLGGDYGNETIEDAARHFNVSPMTVATMLANRGRIAREGVDRDTYSSAA